jgi:hypothetical protein
MTATPLLGPLLRDVDDGALRADDLQVLAGEPRYAGEPAAEVLTVLAWVARRELEGRRDVEAAIRADLDANGHEVYLDFDEAAAELEGAGWEAFCSCSGAQLPPGYLAGREEAVAAAGAHAAAHGGRWAADGIPG